MMKKKLFMKKIKLNLFLSTLFFTLVGCQSVPRDPVEIKESLDAVIKETIKNKQPKALTNVPNSVQQELMLNDMSQVKQGMLAEKRLEI